MLFLNFGVLVIVAFSLNIDRNMNPDLVWRLKHTK